MKVSFVKLLLHIEGFVVFISSLLFFHYLNYNWLLFLVLLFVPDVSILGYLLKKKIGSIAYNIFHSYVLPLVLLAFSVSYNYGIGIQISLIWFSHIGMDRAIGFGLKYPTRFKDTHLGKV